MLFNEQFGASGTRNRFGYQQGAFDFLIRVIRRQQLTLSCRRQRDFVVNHFHRGIISCQVCTVEGE